MGRKRGRFRARANTSNISEVLKSQVGFNEFIADVTIVLTENSMNFNMVQKIINECRPSYFHKFVVLNAENYSKSYILKSICEFIQPFTFQPVHYNKTNDSSYFLAINCLKVIMKIVSNKFHVPHSTDVNKHFKLAIFVNCMVGKDVPIVDTFQNICLVLHKLHDPITNGLNLSNFADNAELINYCPLNDQKIFELVIRGAAEIQVNKLDLSNNSIKDLSGIYLLKDILEELDISSNNLEVISCLMAIDGFAKLKVLNLSNNPLCESYDSFNYALDVKRYCPNLLKLDGRNIVIPEFVKNFLCTPDAKYLAAQFLEHYFTTYDSPDRINLVHLYDVRAIFSVTSKIIPNQSNSKTVKLGHYGINNPYAVCGIGEIMKLFQEFPRSYHDPYPMVCDVTLYTNTNAQIVVTGIFREYTQILSFCRSFHFCHSNDQFRIINEQLHVSNAPDFQLGWSFTFPVDFQYTGNPLPYFKDQFKMFEETMQKLTNMNLEYCQKYLVYCNYDLKKALTLFSELHVSNDVPKEAFEIKKPRPSKSTDTDICEALKKKVLQTHDNISLKTIWATLNRDRMENTNDPPIAVNRSIIRMYRKPNVPEKFEDYPVNVESTTLTKQSFRNTFQNSICNVEKIKYPQKSFLEREAEAAQVTKPVSLVLPQPPKPPQTVPISRSSQINSVLKTVPITKSLQSNPSFDSMNSFSQSSKSKESVQQRTQALFPSQYQHITSTTGNQLPTVAGRSPLPRPTAAAFFSSQQTLFNTQPGPSKYLPENQTPRASKLINIPLVPKKNIRSPSTNTNALNSKDNDENNVPVVAPVKEILTTDAISKLRENLQKEKQRLQDLKNKLSTPNDDETISENENNKAATPQNIVSKADASNDHPRESESNLKPENKTNVEDSIENKDKYTIDNKMNTDEIAFENKQIDNANEISTDRKRIVETISSIGNETTVEKSEIIDLNSGTSNEKEYIESVSSHGNKTIDNKNEINKNDTSSEITEENKNDETISCDQESCQDKTDFETDQQIGNKEIVATMQIDKVAEKTETEYPDFSRNLIIHLHNLLNSEIEEMTTSTPLSLETSSLEEVNQQSEDIETSLTPVDLTDIREDEKGSNNECLDSVDEIKPLDVSQNKGHTDLEVESPSNLVVMSVDDDYQTETPKSETMQVDSDEGEGTFKQRNLVVRLTRLIIDEDHIVKKSATSSRDNFEKEQIITSDINRAIHSPDEPRNEVESSETKSDQETIKLEPEQIEQKFKEEQEKTETDKEAIKQNIEESDLQSTEKLGDMFKLDEQIYDDDDISLNFWNIGSDDND